jgi:tartrate dehydratase beta subunit/fumarate hydratase class I family protein
MYHLKTPLSEEDVAKLRVGDTLYISGVVVAALCTGVGERYPELLNNLPQLRME